MGKLGIEVGWKKPDDKYVIHAEISTWMLEQAFNGDINKFKRHVAKIILESVEGCIE